MSEGMNMNYKFNACLMLNVHCRFRFFLLLLVSIFLFPRNMTFSYCSCLSADRNKKWEVLDRIKFVGNLLTRTFWFRLKLSWECLWPGSCINHVELVGTCVLFSINKLQ